MRERKPRGSGCYYDILLSVRAIAWSVLISRSTLKVKKSYIELSSPIGELPMDWPKDVKPTFGHRCRRIVLEVFHDLIQTIHHWLQTETKTVTDIFQTLFRRLLYA